MKSIQESRILIGSEKELRKKNKKLSKKVLTKKNRYAIVYKVVKRERLQDRKMNFEN